MGEFLMGIGTGFALGVLVAAQIEDWIERHDHRPHNPQPLSTPEPPEEVVP